MEALSGTLLGMSVVVLGPADIIHELRQRQPPGWLETPLTADTPVTPQKVWRIEPHQQDFAVHRGSSDLGVCRRADVATIVMSDLELWVAEHTTVAVVVHAGVVAHSGRALLLPGRSMQGKSTLTVALLALGASFMSDEYALIRDDGTVLAYPRAISMRPRADEPSRAPIRVPATEFGAPVEPGPVPVSLIAALRYDPALGLQFSPMSPGIATLSLVDNAVAAQTQKAAVLKSCARVAGAARSFTGTRGDATEAAVHLLGLLSQR